MSSLTDQPTPPAPGGNVSGQPYNQAHRSTPLGNTATYPYPHVGRTSTQPSTGPPGAAVTGGSHCQPFVQPTAGLRGMQNYPATGYPVMAYPRHYGHAAMFGGNFLVFSNYFFLH